MGLGLLGAQIAARPAIVPSPRTDNMFALYRQYSTPTGIVRPLWPLSAPGRWADQRVVCLFKLDCALARFLEDMAVAQYACIARTRKTAKAHIGGLRQGMYAIIR
jgi:hypothetical protein